MNQVLKRLFSIQSRNALHIRPPTNFKIKGPYREIQGLKLPIYIPVIKNHTPVPPPNPNQFNDSLPENRISVSVTNSPDPISSYIEHYRANEVKIPFIFEDKVKAPDNSFTVSSQEFQFSSKKAAPLIKMTIGKYLFDALYIMRAMDKKIARFAADTIETVVIKEIQARMLDPKHLWVTSVVINRKRRVKGIYYHARGRAGRKHRDFCVLKFTISEKPIKEFYKMMIAGKAPPYLAYVIQERLLEKKASLEEVRNLQPLTHSRGRQQQKLMFRRKVLKQWIEYKKQGFNMRFSLLHEKMLEDESVEFEKKFGNLFESAAIKRERRLAERQALFDKNQKALSA